MGQGLNYPIIMPTPDPRSDMRVFLNRKCGKKKRGK